jgi:hypothetical protein
MEIIMRRRADSQFEKQLDQAGTLSGVDASIAHLMCTSGDGSSDKISVSKARNGLMLSQRSTSN